MSTEGADYDDLTMGVMHAVGGFVGWSVGVVVLGGVASIVTGGTVWLIRSLWLAGTLFAIGVVLMVASMFLAMTQRWGVMRRGWLLIGVFVVIDTAALMAFRRGLIPYVVGDRIIWVAEGLGVIGAALVLFALGRGVWRWIMCD
jgi:hypothetical protein